MSGFSAEWLALREEADHRARNGMVLYALATALARRPVSVVDLGCGTGSNLRATAPKLGEDQRWLLVDRDPRLIEAARARLAAWADHAGDDAGDLVLRSGTRSLHVRFREADLSQDLDWLSEPVPDLVTAAALFDLVSVAFIERVAAAVAAHRTVFYAALTYDGRETWTPPHPSDFGMLHAFHAHQRTDKGFGAAAGPEATAALAAAFERQGYRVRTGDSTWQLASGDRALIAELAAGSAAAVLETGLVPAGNVDHWLAHRRGSTCTIGHTDLVALPSGAAASQPTRVPHAGAAASSAPASVPEPDERPSEESLQPVADHPGR